MSRLLTLGAGNMASALLLGMKEKISSFYAFTPSQTKAKILADQMDGVHIEKLEATRENLSRLDYLFLGFKPQQFVKASDDFISKTEWDGSNQASVIVSMLAGTPLEVLKQKWGTDKVVRIMPNTPSMVGKGMILVLFGEGVKSDERERLCELLGCSGEYYICQNEDQFDALTAVTGSGPAYLFEFARQMALYLEEKGVGTEDQKKLVSQLFLGSSLLMKESSDHFETLRNNVTSKKGVTFEALETFKKNHWEKSTLEGLENNFKRSLELRESALKLE